MDGCLCAWGECRETASGWCGPVLRQEPGSQGSCEYRRVGCGRGTRNGHTTSNAPHPVRSVKLRSTGQVSTTVGDHVGIPGVVLLLLLPFILAPALPTIRYIIALYPPSSFLLLGHCSAFRSLRSNMKKLAAFSIRIHSESVAAFVPAIASGAAAGED